MDVGHQDAAKWHVKLVQQLDLEKSGRIVKAVQRYMNTRGNVTGFDHT
jgi:hypothetical protein